MKLAWSRLAALEMRELRRYSQKHRSGAVALRYLQDVRDAAKRLADDPKLAKPLREGLAIYRVRSHYLIVHADPAADRLTIVRVLHTAMDLERHV